MRKTVMHNRRPLQESGAVTPRGSARDTAVGEGDSSAAPALSSVVPAAWLEQLLLDVVRLPLSQGESPVVEGMVSSLSAILPSYAVGACFVPELVGGPREQMVVRRLPEGAAEVP